MLTVNQSPTMSSQAKPQTKKFQKGERIIPTSTDKALKYYPAEDEAAPRKVCIRKSRIGIANTSDIPIFTECIR
jgi:hypothetical protein